VALPELHVPDGTIQAEVDTGIIPQFILREVWLLKRKGIDLEDIVERLRPRTLPFGYTYSTAQAQRLTHLCESICSRWGDGRLRGRGPQVLYEYSPCTIEGQYS